MNKQAIAVTEPPNGHEIFGILIISFLVVAAMDHQRYMRKGAVDRLYRRGIIFPNPKAHTHNKEHDDECTM